MEVLVHDEGQQRQSRKEDMNKSEKHLKPAKKGTTLKVFSKKQIRHIKEHPGIRLFKQVAYVSINIYIYIYIQNIYIYLDLGQVVQDLLGSSYLW